MLTAVLIAMFIWWFSTGAILWAVSRGAGRGTVFATAPVAVVAFMGLIWAADHTGPGWAYIGFGAAIVIWGWFELAFVTGVITGPVTRPCPPGLNGPGHFLMAWGTVAHHELSLLFTAILLGALTSGLPEQTGLWTFLILFFARISAKLNVYLGVPNLSHEMMPDPVAHMKSYFATRRMNWLFPASVSLLTLGVGCWIARAATQPEHVVGYTLLATLTALALLEHWLMVLPVRDSALWQWMTKNNASRSAAAKPGE